MRTQGRELIWALAAVLVISFLYTLVVSQLGSLPAASGFFGHSLGVIGFLLMLMTETLYSLRKRSRAARWGRMASWLQFHIFTGLVGPYLVFLHTAWKFNGLAGVVLLLTGVTVLSGIIGRYIYTAVPRTADGIEISAQELSLMIRDIEAELTGQAAAQSPAARALVQRFAGAPLQGSGPALVFGRFWQTLAFRLAWWREQRRLDATLRPQAAQLSRLIGQRRALQRQMDTLAAARRLLAAWHAVHIPIGAALFTAAFAHIFAALYYATLLH